MIIKKQSNLLAEVHIASEEEAFVERAVMDWVWDTTCLLSRRRLPLHGQSDMDYLTLCGYSMHLSTLSKVAHMYTGTGRENIVH